MKCRTLFVAILCFGSLLLTAQGAGFISLTVGTRPESVTKGFDGNYFVTLMGGRQPGDGVVAIIKDGKVYSFSTGFDEPKGMGFNGSHLILADLTKVWAVDSQGKKTLIAEEKDFPHPILFLNDVYVTSDRQYVYVSDMGATDKMFAPDGKLWPLGSPEAKALPAVGRVYRIRLKDKKITVAIPENPEMPTPNGIFVKRDGTILVADFFTGNLVESKRGKASAIRTGFRGADGIDMDRKGNIYVSSWTDGKLWRISMNPAAVDNPKVLIDGLQSAADFYVDDEAQRIVIPDMNAGKLIFLPMK